MCFNINESIQIFLLKFNFASQFSQIKDFIATNTFSSSLIANTITLNYPLHTSLTFLKKIDKKI